MQATINYGGSFYYFSRDNAGVGRWYNRRGTVPGSIGLNRENTAVPIILSNELSKEAVRLGLGDHKMFARTVKHEKPEKTPREKGKSRRVKKSKLLSSFNPFNLSM